MSDEFRQVAEKEINEELDANFQILKSCNSDDDVHKNSSEIKKNLHKIKGLAPMMGQNSIGEIASLNDSLIKKILDGYKIEGVLDVMIQSNQLMKKIMQDSTTSIDELKQTIKTKYSAFLD